MSNQGGASQPSPGVEVGASVPPAFPEELGVTSLPSMAEVTSFPVPTQPAILTELEGVVNSVFPGLVQQSSAIIGGNINAVYAGRTSGSDAEFQAKSDALAQALKGAGYSATSSSSSGAGSIEINGETQIVPAMIDVAAKKGNYVVGVRVAKSGEDVGVRIQVAS